RGEVVITMDADMQDSPDEIPGLRRMILEEKYDMVSGWKKVRHDPVSKTLPSKFFNWTTARVSKIPLHDFNCGLKAYRKKVVKGIEVYGEMHRYIPVIAKWSGFRKIGEKVVEHRARKYGTRPMHFFGPVGVLVWVLGFAEFVSLVIQKLGNRTTFTLTNRPSFYIALASVIVGTQLFLTGFVAELISRNSSSRNAYLIEQQLGLENP